MTKPYSVPNKRKVDYPIDKIFLDRWSPRSLSYEDFLEDDLKTLFEAARWTPSSSNAQPWRFLYAMNGSEEWNKFFGLLGEFNQLWCNNAGALIVLVSRNHQNHFLKELNLN